MIAQDRALTRLGWQPFFQQQLTLDEQHAAIPARIIEQYSTEITVTTRTETLNVTLLPSMPEMVVGDWLLLDAAQQLIRLLERKTCFSRKAAGSKLSEVTESIFSGETIKQWVDFIKLH